MNFCKDCKHFAQEGNVTLCLATAISLIDGVSRHSVDHCTRARSRNGRCGLEGRLYEGLKADLIVMDEMAAEAPAKKPRKPRAAKAAQEEPASE